MKTKKVAYLLLFLGIGFLGFAQQNLDEKNKLQISEPLFESIIQTKSEVICNGEAKFIKIDFAEKDILSYTPKSTVVKFENNGIWVQPIENTTYKIIYQSNNGLIKTLKIETELEFVTARFSVNPSIGTAPFSIEIFNESENAVSYKWDLGTELSYETTPRILYNEQGTHEIKLIAKGALGCEGISIKKDIQVFEEGEFFIPNAFTPNFDGRNETFFVIPKNIKEFSCLVYNQHGDLVNTLSSKEEAWDGYFNGYPAPSGSYIYKIQYTNLADEIKKIIGAVELRR